MNYTMQFPDIIPNRPLDYSRQALPTLDESALIESLGVIGAAGRTTVYGAMFGVNDFRPLTSPLNQPIDWNNDGNPLDIGIAANINRISMIGDCNVEGLTQLVGSEDWSRLIYNFRFSPDYADGLSPVAHEPNMTVDEAVAVALAIDFDHDGHVNANDNCPATANGDQRDSNGDGVGDACQTTGSGDVNDDGQVNVADIDFLCAAVLAGTANPLFDLDGDDTVDKQDLTFLVRDILQTSAGDANLDGIFDSADLILVFQRGHYEDNTPRNSGWGDGDWNCDGEFDSGDLVAAFQAGAYTANATVADVWKTGKSDRT
jgi:hypothetical protein